jgi:DNA-binding NtrC family response regulator
MGMKEQLFVIDDDADILKVLKANLELYGFHALTAGTWAQAQVMMSSS